MNDKKSNQWDLCRFLKTLTYFEVFPLLNWIQNILQNRPTNQQDQPTGRIQMGIILVAGATGGVGKRVVIS